MKTPNQQGFTLMELLIVFSIISILALFGVSSSRRTIDKTKNVRKVANIRGMVDTVSAYTADNGSLPTPLEDVRNGAPSFAACLGRTTSDADTDGLSGCHIVASGGYEESSLLNDDLRTVNASLPLIDDNGVNFAGTGVYWGAALVYFDSTAGVTVNGVERRLWLMYALSGRNQTCESFGGEVVSGGTLPNWTATQGSNTGLQVSGNTICYVAMTREFGR